MQPWSVRTSAGGASSCTRGIGLAETGVPSRREIRIGWQEDMKSGCQLLVVSPPGMGSGVLQRHEPVPVSERIRWGDGRRSVRGVRVKP